MAKIRTMFSTNLNKIGRVSTVTEEEAATLVREGRAVRVPEPPAEPEQAPKPAAAPPAPVPPAGTSRP